MKKSLFVSSGKYLQIKNFVKPELCQKWQKRILSDRKYWSPGFSGWTYGLAWYVLIEHGNLHLYHHQAKSLNQRIQKLPQYLEVMKSASRYLVGPQGQRDLPVRSRVQNLGPYWSLSGFHINLNAGDGEIHADYEGLSPYPEMLFHSKTRAYSAVLSLSVPDQGGGLFLWEKRHRADQPMKLSKKDKRYLSYEVGDLTLFDSFLYHQVEGSKSKKNFRITAVMHFLYREKPYPHWEYWF
ncbi:MAG: hypothetical protein IPJ69_08130 [Deltaproteobacteria bacterium]|nr:MAG: hypothetical protein IPJ69_08130 [Deltaproteobacteria bacterium]